MKRITNILSYLWLLMLLMVTACSDLEEEVGPMQGDEEVELTIPVEIPGMKATSRTVPTENITQITAIAFDENGDYIKTRQAVLTRDGEISTRGTLRIKVPSKTRSIHFLAKNGTDETFSGITSLDLLKSSTSEELHYWGFLSFASTAELKAFSHFLTLYRNQAMITLEAGEGDYIAGFVNYNTTGTLVPYSDEHGFSFKIATQDGVVYQTIPSDVEKTSTIDGNNLGVAHYLFEHENNKNSQPLYAICKIGSKFYKVAFARTIDNNLTYFPVIRNFEYKIVIDPTVIDTNYGFDDYNGAKESPSPINDVVIQTVDLSLTPSTQDLIISGDGEKKCTISVSVPTGITNLEVSAPDVFTITPPDGVTTIAEGEYTVTPGQEYDFTFTLADNYNTTGTATINFSGSGPYYKANDVSATILLKKSTTLTINPTSATINNTAGTTTQIEVTIPSSNINKLQIDCKAFTVTPPDGLTLQNETYYNVNPSNTYNFTFTLKEGYTGDQPITFTGSSDYWTATATATITLASTLGLEIVAADTDNPSLTYGPKSIEDLQVKLTIPAGVTSLTFSSEDFTIRQATDKKNSSDIAYLTNAAEEDNGNIIIRTYTVNNVTESIILPFRLRLNDNVSEKTASFTFTTNGEGLQESSVTGSVALIARNPDDETIYWEGYLPLDLYDNTTKLSIPKGDLTVGKILVIECTQPTSGTFEVLRDGEHFDPYLEYNTAIATVPLTEDMMGLINEKIIITGRPNADMTLLKVSLKDPVNITATPYVTTLNYSANSVSDLIVNVTIPKEVSTLTFDSEYFDVAMVGSVLTATDNAGEYTVVHANDDNPSTSTSIRLRLKEEKKAATTAGFTFSGTTTNENLAVIPADVNDITLTESGDGYVRWQGDVELNWNNEGAVKQIPLLYSWFYDANDQLIIPVGSTLHLEYELTSDSGASIQFAECNETWNDDAYYFSELRVVYDNNGTTETMGLNLDNNTGIYSDHTTSIDLILTQDVLENMVDNRTDLLGETDVVMAIQGGNVRLKSISVIPQAVTSNILVALPGGDAQTSVNTSLNYGSGETSFEEFTVDVTVPAGVTQINIDAADFDVRTEPTSTITTYSFEQNDEEQTKRFKFTLKAENKSDKESTITISDNSGSAESATVIVDLSPRDADADGTVTVWSGLMALEWSTNYLAVNSYLPIGTKVTLNFTNANGGSFEMHDCNGTVFRLNGVDYPNSDDWISVGSEVTQYEFTITEQTTIYSNNSYVAITNAIDGLRINGDGLVMTSIVVDYSSVPVGTFEYSFDDDSTSGISSWGNNSTREIYTDTDADNKVLKLYNPSSVNSWEAQVALDRVYVPGNYTLTYKIKGDTTGTIDTIDQGFQYFYDPIETNTQFKNASGFPQTNVTTEWQEIEIEFTVTRACNRFLLNIGTFSGTIYIDDLKLVKN